MKKMLLMAVTVVLAASTFGTTGARWFRLTFKQKYSWVSSSKSNLRVAAWFFYDANGAAIPLSITSVSGVTAAEMPAGTSMLQTPYTASAGIEANLFNGKYSGESAGHLEITGLPTQDKEPYCLMSVNDSTTWSTVTVHLNDGLPLVDSYQLYVGYQNWSGTERSPSRWTVEASYDGTTWFVADDRTAADVKSPSGPNLPYNNGVSFPLKGDRQTIGLPDGESVSTLYGDDVLAVKAGEGTTTVVQTLGDADVRVDEGTLLYRRIDPTSAKWFRFTVKKKYGLKSEASKLALLEFGLFDADTVEQNAGYGVCAASVSAADMPKGTVKVDNPYTALADDTLKKLTDGNLTSKMEIQGITLTADGYPGITPGDPSTWITFYFHLKDEARPVVGYNLRLGEQNWSGTERSPSEWTMEASSDGVNWIVVDDRTDGEVKSPGAPSRWFNYDAENPDAITPFAVDYAAETREGAFSVAADATLSFTRTYRPGTIVNAGTVTGAAGSALAYDPADGLVVSAVGGGITGSIGIEKTGAGTLELDGDNSFTGDVAVRDGTVRFGRTAAVNAKWFRFTVKKKYGLKSFPGYLALLEFGLFDADTVEQNVGYDVCAASVSAADMPKGTVKVDNPYTALADATLKKLTDGDLTSKMEIQGITLTEDGFPGITPNDPSTWITFTFHLKDDAKPIVGYNLRVGEQNWSGTERSPSEWTMEASYDGVSWFVVDDRTDGEVKSPGAPSRWFNYDAENPDAIMPFALHVTPSVTAALPSAAKLSVASDATVEIADGSQVGRLLVDLDAGAGTIDGFNPAANGTLDLVGGAVAPDAATELPLTLANVVNAANLKSWTVKIDGEATDLRFRIANGRPTVGPAQGLVLIFR